MRLAPVVVWRSEGSWPSRPGDFVIQFRIVGLMVLDQLFDPFGIRLRVAVACKGVRATRAFDEDRRPHEAGLDVDRSDLAYAHTDLVASEPRPLAKGDRLLADLDYRRKQVVSARPSACMKDIGWHSNSPVLSYLISFPAFHPDCDRYFKIYSHLT